MNNKYNKCIPLSEYNKINLNLTKYFKNNVNLTVYLLCIFIYLYIALILFKTIKKYKPF